MTACYRLATLPCSPSGFVLPLVSQNFSNSSAIHCLLYFSHFYTASAFATLTKLPRSSFSSPLRSLQSHPIVLVITFVPSNKSHIAILPICPCGYIERTHTPLPTQSPHGAPRRLIRERRTSTRGRHHSLHPWPPLAPASWSPSMAIAEPIISPTPPDVPATPGAPPLLWANGLAVGRSLL